jgi:hypothetical protein
MSRRLARMTSGLYLPGLSRRGFLRGAGLSAAALGGSSLLAACGTEGAQVEAGSCRSTDLSSREKEIVFSNWIGYVDPVKAKDTSTLEKFQRRPASPSTTATVTSTTTRRSSPRSRPSCRTAGPPAATPSW